MLDAISPPSTPTAKTLATAIPDAAGEVVHEPAPGADVAGELLRRRRQQRVEDQGDDRALAEAEEDEPDDHDELLPLVAHGEREDGEPEATTTKPNRASTRGGEPLVQAEATKVLATKIESVYGMTAIEVSKLVRPARPGCRAG